MENDYQALSRRWDKVSKGTGGPLRAVFARSILCEKDLVAENIQAPRDPFQDVLDAELRSASDITLDAEDFDEFTKVSAGKPKMALTVHAKDKTAEIGMQTR